LFTNPDDPDQHTHFADLAEQVEIPLLFCDESLSHRLSKRLRNMTARLLATIPPKHRDFDQAKADILEGTQL